jgi:hypothetical protein
MSLEDAMAEFEDAGDEVEKLSHKLQALGDQAESLIKAASQYAIDRCQPVAVGMLLKNYDKAGLGKASGDESHGYKSTGLMRQTIAASMFFLSKAGKKLVAAMPTQAANYKDGSSIYTVTQTLNSGGVHVPHAVRAKYDLSLVRKTNKGNLAGARVGQTKRSVWGARAKRTLKKFALSDKAPSKQSSVWLAGMAKAPWGYKGQHVFPEGKLEKKSTSQKGTVSLGHGVTVTRARHFYEFNAEQKTTLNDLYRKYLVDYLKKAISEL